MGVTGMEEANAYLQSEYLANFNVEFILPAREPGSAFVPGPDPAVLDNILCEHHERTVGQDNCVQYQCQTLQIPADRHHCHYIKARVLEYPDGSLSIHHGLQELARHDAHGHSPRGSDDQ